jgi:predicted  nucleic acid-binding Zn-ribbon protein
MGIPGKMTTEDGLKRQIELESKTKYVTREEYERSINTINTRIDTLADEIKELKEASQRHTDRLISIINDSNKNLQAQITSILNQIIQSKNNVVKEAIRTKDKSTEMQYKMTTTVLKYELAKGGFAGLIISAVILLLKVMKFI